MNVVKVLTFAMLFSNIAYAQDDLPKAKSTLFSNVNLSVADYNNQPLVISASGIALKMRKFAVARDNLVFAEKGSSLAAAAGDVASMAEFDKWVRKLRAGGIKPSAWGKALDVVNQPNSGTTL